MALTIPNKCVSLELTRQHHFNINLTCSLHGIAEELFQRRSCIYVVTPWRAHRQVIKKLGYKIYNNNIFQCYTSRT